MHPDSMRLVALSIARTSVKTRPVSATILIRGLPDQPTAVFPHRCTYRKQNCDVVSMHKNTKLASRGLSRIPVYSLRANFDLKVALVVIADETFLPAACCGVISCRREGRVTAPIFLIASHVSEERYRSRPPISE